MPEDNQNPTLSEPSISEETPTSPSTTESIPPADSKPSDMPSEAPEAPTSNLDTTQVEYHKKVL